MTETAVASSATTPRTRPRVVVFDPIPGGWSFDSDAAVLGARGVDLLVPDDEPAADTAIRTADAVIVTGVRRLDAARVATMERCAGILCYSIGMDKVDGPAASAAGIPVRNVPDYCTDEVSDHALTLLLAAQRRLLPIASATAAGEWPLRDRAQLATIRRLRGQILGIAGAGRTGRLVARKARGFGFRTIAHDPFVTDPGDPELELVDLDELLRRAHAIVICAALTPGAPPLISREALQQVQPGLILVNVARGGHVDEAALAEALQDGRVAVAALDVRAIEPPPQPDPLAGLANVIQTPHIAASSREAAEDLHRLAAQYVLGLLEDAGRIPVAG
jgi:phosphoglycerate dehydrogenase-like enzyme